MRVFHDQLWKFTTGGLLLVSSASGDPTLAPQYQAVRVEPLRVAGIAMESGRVRLATAWFDYQPGAGTRSRWAWTWDAFEADTPNPAFGRPAGGYPACNDPPEMRWYFGPTYQNPYTSADMLECVPGVECEGVFFAWFWAVGGQGTSERCYVAVTTFEDWSGCTAPNPGSGPLGGVVYDFGELEANDPQGQPRFEYYYAAIDLSGTPLRHRMPLDGAGGFQLRYGRDFDSGSGEFTTPTLCQTMLWATGDAEFPYDGRVGEQSIYQFDDDNPPDGQFDLVRECYDYLFGLCQHTLCACVGFSARIGDDCACAGDIVADGRIGLSDLTALLASFGVAAPDVFSACADIDQSGEVDLPDLALLLSQMGSDCP